MPTAKVTKRSVDALRASDRDTYLWDTELAGFGLKMTPAGGRTYLVQYRIGGRKGRTRRVTIGKHGALTPDQARQEARRVLGQVASGHDPAEERTKAREDLTVSELCDLYLAEGCATKKASTLATDKGRIERHIKPLLGRRKTAELSRADIERFMQDVANGKTAADIKTGKRGRAIVEGGKGTAARTVGLLGGILTFAVERGLRADNPARGIKRYRLPPRERFLSAKELATLGEILAKAEADFHAANARAQRGERRKSGRKGKSDPVSGENPYAIAALRLLMLTGCRKSEVLSLRWEWVDFERAILRLPDSKTGAKVVPLGAPALELLNGLERVENNPHVFPSATGEGHFVGLPKVWRKVRDTAGLSDVRLHDLRHSFASVGAAGGDSLYVIGKLLGHADSATTQRYAHLHDDPLRAAADRIAGQISAAMNGSIGEVVELPKRGA